MSRTDLKACEEALLWFRENDYDGMCYQALLRRFHALGGSQQRLTEMDLLMERIKKAAK